MKLHRCDRSLLGGYQCKCEPKDAVCEFPTVGEVVIRHHHYCPVNKSARVCDRQFRLWLAAARGRAKSKKFTCRCCKHCVHVKSLSGHCVHCPRNDRFLDAQDQAVQWKNLLWRIADT